MKRGFLLFGLLFFLGCASSSPDESLINKDDLAQSLMDTYNLEMDSYEVLRSKSASDEYSADISCTAHYANNYADYTVEGQAIYRKYDQGWMLDDISWNGNDNYMIHNFSKDEIENIINAEIKSESLQSYFDRENENGFGINTVDAFSLPDENKVHYKWQKYPFETDYYSESTTIDTCLIYNNATSYFDVDDDEYSFEIKLKEGLEGTFEDTTSGNRIQISSINDDEMTFDLSLNGGDVCTFTYKSTNGWPQFITHSYLQPQDREIEYYSAMVSLTPNMIMLDIPENNEFGVINNTYFFEKTN